MTKIVCVKCEIEYRPKTNGVVVVEMASFGPYKVWQADMLVCPGCGTEIVAGFGFNPLRQDHYSPDFPKWLDALVHDAVRVIYDNEKEGG